MKKLLSLLLVIVLCSCTLLACGNTRENGTNGSSNESNDPSDNSGGNSNIGTSEAIKVSVLNGTTGFGMAYLMEQNSNNQLSNKYEINIETDATAIVASLLSGSIDMAALPTNAAANVYNKSNGKVQVIAINTLGVLYLAQKDDQIKEIGDLDGKTIYVPAQNPTFIAKYILDSNNITAKLDSTTYDTPAALQAAVVAGQVDLAILPQPVITAAIAGAKNAGHTYTIALDLTEEWNKIPGSEKLVQGCLVATKSFIDNNKSAVDAFLAEYENSINYLNTNVKEVAGLIVKHKIFANATVAEKAIPSCNVAFMSGYEMKNAMSAFIEAMYGIAPSSVGNKIPDNGFYYIP